MLTLNQIATFKTYNNKHIVGKVVGIFNNGVYLVLAVNGELCKMYTDGLFRFPPSSVVLK